MRSKVGSIPLRVPYISKVTVRNTVDPSLPRILQPKLTAILFQIRHQHRNEVVRLRRTRSSLAGIRLAGRRFFQGGSQCCRQGPRRREWILWLQVICDSQGKQASETPLQEKTNLLHGCVRFQERKQGFRLLPGPDGQHGGNQLRKWKIQVD